MSIDIPISVIWGTIFFLLWWELNVLRRYKDTILFASIFYGVTFLVHLIKFYKG
jgi:hypothetical protein